MAVEEEREIKILLVEDSPEDIELTKFAFRKSRIANRIDVANDGIKCMEYLTSVPRHAFPDLILLDLNMPRKGGKEVLEELKAHPDFRLIPVIILTTSQAREDINDSYAMHANGYITKPIDFHEFGKVVEAIEGFWFNLVQLPGPLLGN